MSYPMSKITNLCYLENTDGKILLIMKKRGFGEGKWNGPGGKVQENENHVAAVCREVEEETGLKPINPKQRGLIEFVWADKPAWNQRCSIFYTKEYEGDLQESEEALPQWFDKDQIPLDKMWEDDSVWLMDLLNGQKIKYRFFFDKNNKIASYEKM